MSSFSNYDMWKLRSPDDDRPEDEFEPELEEMDEADWLEKQELEMNQPIATFTVRLFADRSQMHVSAKDGDPQVLLRRAISVLEAELDTLQQCPFHRYVKD